MKNDHATHRRCLQWSELLMGLSRSACCCVHDAPWICRTWTQTVEMERGIFTDTDLHSRVYAVFISKLNWIEFNFVIAHATSSQFHMNVQYVLNQPQSVIASIPSIMTPTSYITSRGEQQITCSEDTSGFSSGSSRSHWSGYSFSQRGVWSEKVTRYIVAWVSERMWGNVVIALKVFHVLTGLTFSEMSAFAPITTSVNSFSTCWISSPEALGFSSRCWQTWTHKCTKRVELSPFTGLLTA